MRMIVQRERERMAFVSASYSSITANLEADSIGFEAKLTILDGQKLAGTKSFDSKGVLVQEALVLTPEEAAGYAAKLKGQTLKVSAVEAKPSTRKPYAPFTTSTLQQEASKKLGMSAKQAMDTAQMLYQDGHITYMRTDSPSLSGQASSAAIAAAKELFGAESVASAPRMYGAKSKNAQEAHEAIRPSGEKVRSPR